MRCVRSGGGASKKMLPDTPSSCRGIAVGACHWAPAIHADGGAPTVVEDEAGVRVLEGVLGVGVEVGCGVGCTSPAVAAVAGNRRLIFSVKAALLGMLAGGTTISAEENSASATLSSTVISAARSRHATHPPARAASSTQRRFATARGRPCNSGSGSGGGGAFAWGGGTGGAFRCTGGQEWDMAASGV